MVELQFLGFLTVIFISFIISYVILVGIISIFASLIRKKKFLKTFLSFFDKKVAYFLLSSIVCILLWWWLIIYYMNNYLID